MISSPLKQTNEIDWNQPLKSYIKQTYGDDPERYAEECNTLNRLRQDMRGAGKDSTAGRDLLYRYYGQLELLDLRFPVDENHIKISFTWCIYPLQGLLIFINVLTNLLTGSTHLRISLRLSTHLLMRKHQSYSISQRHYHATQHFRTETMMQGRSQPITHSRHRRACLRISTKTSSMRHQKILVERL